MAKVTLNPLMERIRGKIGELVFKRFFDRTIVGRNPDRSGLEPSAAQTAVRSRFGLAAGYARAVFADPVRKQAYVLVAKARGVPAFALTLGDYLKPPVVQVLDLSAYQGHVGDLVGVEATDDVEVVGVTVAVRNDGGEVLEQGPAELVNGRWQYAATVAIAAGETLTVEATATDRPGHTGTKSVLVVLEA